jgi:hypothetical protein
MKVLLVNPDSAAQEGFSNPPLGLAYLAGTLEAHQIEVMIVFARAVYNMLRARH